MNAEQRRLDEAARMERHWRRWGTYLSERQWGTVREDYSENGDAWSYFPFDHAHRRAYRWGEDGLLGFSDNHQRLCFSVALWNGHDPILKERMFGLSNDEGNHGEDVKELYYYLDATPTYSYAKALYKYPQAEFPYGTLRARSAEATLSEPEFELHDTGVFDEGRYFDVSIEYAKADADDILIRVRVVNRGSERATLHVLPQLWFRNRWSWGKLGRPKPRLLRIDAETIVGEEFSLGRYRWWAGGAPSFLFTENESNTEALWKYPSGSRHYKDAFHARVVEGRSDAVMASPGGTKAASWYVFELDAGATREIRLRLTNDELAGRGAEKFDEIFAARIQDAAEFYSFQAPADSDARNVQRQAFASLLWSRQFYHFVVEQWLAGDPAGPKPPASRLAGRNHGWIHVHSNDVLSMPDNWEYPWFASWDLGFHMLPMALLDPEYAKRQLAVLLREWYLHPNGQIPAYEWNFEDVNPPVHAWAAWRVYQIDRAQSGHADHGFLEAVFHKLLMNFTWWVNRKDSASNNIFEGGFLGLDNIGVFDRSRPLPTSEILEQADATSWMAMYALNMLHISVELAQYNRVYEDVASKFYEHFLYIAHAINRMGGEGLWDEEDGFYYDRLQFDGGSSTPLRVRSMVGLLPLLAVETFDPEMVCGLDGFKRRTQWFRDHRPDLCGELALFGTQGTGKMGLLSLMDRPKLERVLKVMLMESEFLSPHGLRSMSRYHLRAPYVLEVNGEEHRVDYEPAESRTHMFGGNSNWRGPVWFPLNYLIIEALQKYHHYYGDEVKVEFPTGSGRRLNLAKVAAELSGRLASLFLRGTEGRRPCYGGVKLLQEDAQFRDHLLFHEYFHGDSGAGLGASHQTGWTALVAYILQQKR